jgi:beta-phosphoglucomutase
MQIDPNWHILETQFFPKQLHQKETVFTSGNGYLCSRGAFEEGYPGEEALTFLHGVFDDIPTFTSELANAPNWLNLSIYINGERFRLSEGKLLDYRRDLDLSNGVVSRAVRWQSMDGKTVDVYFERFASLADPHVMGVRLRIVPLDFTGGLEFRADIPGRADTDGVLHWEPVDQGCIGRNGAFLHLRTKATDIEYCQTFDLRVQDDEAEYEYWDAAGQPTVVARLNVQPEQEVVVEKLVTTYTTRDLADPQIAAMDHLEHSVQSGYAALYRANQAAWEQRWAQANVSIRGDAEADRALRYSLFQLLIAASQNDARVSIAAKTLSGLGYRGHVFWDTEIFILPFFSYTQPETARNLLLYRYHTLPGARRKAQAAGYEGAMYAWESAATGDETTPRWVPLPDGELVRIWCGDIEHHISADVAYAIVQYWRITGDDAFMRDYGAEIVLDTARFWGSRVEWDAERQVYAISDVIGPDEYHEHVDDNVYTNALVRWHLKTALDLKAWLEAKFPEKARSLTASLDLSAERSAHWEDVIAKLVLNYDPETGLFEQFNGYAALETHAPADYEPRRESYQQILGIQGVQKTQFIKQPDVMMMLYLLPEQFDREVIEKNFAHYTPRTDLAFGSSLGPAIQAALAAQLGDPAGAYEHFMHAARTDLEDVRGNAAHGIHAATNGGLWQAAVFGFGGLRLTEAGPQVSPQLPPKWKRLQFSIQSSGQMHTFDLRPDTVDIQGVIFDLDGVLTDTSEYHFLGWKRLAEEEGLPFTRRDNEALRGISRRESLLLLLKGREVPEGQMQEMMACKNRYYQEFLEQLTPEAMLPGAGDFLAELRTLGIKVAIGSASKNARMVIEKLEIVEQIDALADGHSVQNPKPAPDVFLHAAEQLGVPPQNCIVFEDAEAGVAAALAGGMWAAGIGPVERVGAADIVLPNLAGVTWQEIIERLTMSNY